MICASDVSQLHKANIGDRFNTPKQDTNDFTTEEFLQFVQYTSFVVLGPEFHVSGDSVTYTISELTSMYQEMKNRGEAYLRYLDKQNQEEPDYGSS